MKFIPILFSTEMVQAILAGRKTQTRRVVKPQPDDGGLWNDDKYPRSFDSKLKGWNGTTNDTAESKEFRCPYGQVGDVLWVRESFNIKTEIFPEEKKVFIYKETMVSKNRPASTEWKWKPSIHMPKDACRIFLQIKDIRVERLNDISQSDAKAEGIAYSKPERFDFFKDYTGERYHLSNPIESFRSLWHKINGPTSWVKNPWVWVIEFERIEKPENF